MAKKIKIRKIGNSLGVILPRELIDELRVEEGDSLYCTGGKNEIKLTANNPKFADDLAVFKALNKRYRNALDELAK
ncbi:MAG: AbrB/MazE/SpoVT family DNA-binding domain-containing protein [Verrucomicrobia bacterium]|nr:AbrB/MazE/SpoVT family DNA-binding domain-containing protein [Verrucomicrobiota bacterium]